MPNPQARSWSKATAGSRPTPSARISSPAGGGLSARQIDEGLKGLYATGLFQDIKIRQAGGRLVVTVIENPVINRIAFEGNRKAKDEQLLARNPVQGARHAVAPDGAVRHAAHHRAISPERPLQRSGRRPRSSSCRTTASIWSSRSAKARRPASRPSSSSATRPIRDFRLKDVIKTTETQLAELPEIVRRLRSGPARGRPRPAAPLLSQARLCRCAHRRGDQRVRSGMRAASS